MLNFCIFKMSGTLPFLYQYEFERDALTLRILSENEPVFTYTRVRVHPFLKSKHRRKSKICISFCIVKTGNS